MLKPLLATVKKYNEGVLPIAQKFGEDVLKKSTEKLKPCLMPALTALGDSLDTYSKIVTRFISVWIALGSSSRKLKNEGLELPSGQFPS
ncbi:sister chromatid cohesion protein PDS5-like protein isoform X1 [Tanacetum coccineum]